MRRKKNILSFDTDSALSLMQEIYNDIVEQKQTASMITKKMLLKITVLIKFDLQSLLRSMQFFYLLKQKEQELRCRR